MEGRGGGRGLGSSVLRGAGQKRWWCQWALVVSRHGFLAGFSEPDQSRSLESAFKHSHWTLGRDRRHAQGCSLSRRRAEVANRMEQMGFVQRTAWLISVHPPFRKHRLRHAHRHPQLSGIEPRAWRGLRQPPEQRSHLRVCSQDGNKRWKLLSLAQLPWLIWCFRPSSPWGLHLFSYSSKQMSILWAIPEPFLGSQFPLLRINASLASTSLQNASNAQV